MSFQISDVFVKVLILDIDLFLHMCFANIFFFSVIQSCPTVFGPWTVAPCQAPLSMKFSRQECCSGLPFPTPEDHPNSGIKPTFPALTDKCFTIEPPGKPRTCLRGLCKPS